MTRDKKIYTLGGIEFYSKDAIIKHCQSIKDRAVDGEQIRDPVDVYFLRELLGHHPHAAEKIGPGIRGFCVRRNPDYPTGRCFYVRRIDGTELNFSFNECVNESTERDKVLAAMRRAVDDQLIHFKLDAFSDGKPKFCVFTGEQLLFNTAHVDHQFPRTFLALVNAWLTKNNLSWATVPLDTPDGKTVEKMADHDQFMSWRMFHAHTAHLRILSRTGNLSHARKLKKGKLVP